MFFELLELIETAQEEQVSNLFDHFERVGDAACPEGVPDAVDVVVNFTGEHLLFGL